MTLLSTLTLVTNDPRRTTPYFVARAGAANIVPNSTGAASYRLVIPELNGKLTDLHNAFHPTDQQVTELLCSWKKNVTVDEVNAAMKAAAN